MKVLLAEDSRTVIAYLEAIFRQTADVTLLPVAHDGASAVEAACALRPDLILMDLMLPVLDGIEAIRQIMALVPCPIVVLSEHVATPQGDRTFEALAAGAVDVLAKPSGVEPKQAAEFAERLIAMVRLMVTARVVRRPARTGPASAGSSSPWRGRFELVAIGASVGGPQLLWELLRQLPAPFPLPIVICQHILAGFEQGLAAWLSRTRHAVRVAAPGDRPQAGRVLLAPSERHLVLRNGRCEYVAPAERSLQRQMTPSVDVLFESLAESIGRRCVALLLTGMGEDGARGLHELRKRGALTVAQNGESCVVDGMPAAARALGAAELELTPAGMVKLLLQVGTP
ncbi:MAG: chemotaxis protein CheB [Polyangia bacterium]